MTDTRHLDLHTADGHTVSAIATTPAGAMAACVLAHGAGAGMAHPFMEQVAQGLAQRQVACLRYQFPYMQAGSRRVDNAATAHATVRAAVALAGSLWPGLALFAGGKSFGGRMSSQAQALAALPRVRGLVFLGFPFHAAGKPALSRAEHLAAIRIPLLFIRGTRDALAEAPICDAVLAGLGQGATRIDIEGADHGFGVLKRSGRSHDEVLACVLDRIAAWLRMHTAATP